MTTRPRTRILRRAGLRRLAAVLTASAVAALTIGAATIGTAGAGSSDLPDEIVIGYQNIPNGDLIVKNKRWLEKAFGDDVTISWKVFDSGGLVNEAFAAGGLDIGLAGSSPVSRGLSTGIEYQVPWIFDVIGEAEALVVRDDIDSIEDLAGKTVATPTASTAHYSLLAALEDAGLSENDLNIIDAEPDAIFAAWTQGDIDGAYVWNPNLASIIDEGGKVLITSADLAEQGKTTYDLAVVSTDFAEQYPDALEIWVEQQDRAVRLIKNKPKAAAKAIAAELNIKRREARAQIADLIFVDASEQATDEYLGGGLADNLFAAATFNQRLGEIPNVAPERTYRNAVLVTFAERVAQDRN